MIFINGYRASKKDLNTLKDFLKNGKVKILQIKTTKKNNISILTK